MPEPSDVVTRFAPSPTGSLHIGGARTALFNWLYAKHHGGKFLLRVEDTDRARSTPESVQTIIDGMKWLGLDWDNKDYADGYYSQYAQRALQLLTEILSHPQQERFFLRIRLVEDMEFLVKATERLR